MRQKDYYLALMHHNNLNVVFADKKIYNQPFNKKNGNNFLIHINALRSIYKEHIYAIDVGDEPTGCKAGQVKDWVRFFYSSNLNSSKIPVFYNLLPTYATNTLFSPTCSTPASYSDYLNAFVSSDLNNSSPFVSFDHYPFGPEKSWRSDYFENLRLIKNKCNSTGGKPFWITIGTNFSVLQRKLTYEELKFSVFTPIAYGAKGIMYWTYNNFIDRDLQLYRNVQKINRYVKNIIGPVVMKSENIATLHKGNTSLNGSNYFTAEETISGSFRADMSLLKDVSSNDIVVGIFREKASENKIGRKENYYYLWLVNKKTGASEVLSNIILSLNGNFSNRVKIAPSCDAYNATLNPSYKPMAASYNPSNNTTQVIIRTLHAGEGILLIMNK